MVFVVRSVNGGEGPLSISVTVTKKLEIIYCRFLWGDSMESGKYHLVPWDTIKRLLNQGKMDLKSYVKMNHALQGKGLWRRICTGKVPGIY